MAARTPLQWLIVTTALLGGACGSTTGPTPPPPPTEEAPTIVCPTVPPVQLTGNAVSGAATFATPTPINGKPPVTVACVPASGSLFPIGTTGVSCTATDALQRIGTCAFQVTVLAPVQPPRLAVTSFFAFGDSITRGEDGINLPSSAPSNCSSVATSRLRFGTRVILPEALTYPGQLLQSLRARYTLQSPAVDNQGCPGEAVTDPGTFARFAALTSSRRYEAVLLMEGSNDLMLAAHDGTGFSGAINGLRAMVSDAKSRGLRPLLATIPPIDPAGSRGKDWGADKVPAFNADVRSVALSAGVPLVDVYAAFGGNLKLLGSDGLHPTAEGYTVIAGAFADAIKSTLETPAPATSQRRR